MPDAWQRQIATPPAAAGRCSGSRADAMTASRGAADGLKGLPEPPGRGRHCQARGVLKQQRWLTRRALCHRRACLFPRRATERGTGTHDWIGAVPGVLPPPAGRGRDRGQASRPCIPRLESGMSGPSSVRRRRETRPRSQDNNRARARDTHARKMCHRCCGLACIRTCDSGMVVILRPLALRKGVYYALIAATR
jgi:hypothetical protein